MRCIYGTFAICLLVGCQNQAIPLSNPFLSPDRVPPPATRTLLPGTAQPYYPGDPVPSLQPAPGAVIPPTYAPGTAFPSAAPVVPTTPPGGWNPQPPTYPAQPVPATPSPYRVNPASAELPLGRVVAVSELPVQIQTDEQNLRFNTPAIQTLANVEPLEPITPNQTVVQAQFENVQPPTQPWAPMLNVSATEVVPREVTLRAVSSPGSNQNNSSGFRSPSRDGFRPQGSRRRAGQANTAAGNIPQREFAPVSETIERFGFDPQYGWLRGQLEYDPTSQQWQLRYIPLQGSPDQFGGRLPIANPMLLGDLQPGDHVQVQGQLNSLQSGPTTTMPVFTISVVQRQR